MVLEGKTNIKKNLAHDQLKSEDKAKIIKQTIMHSKMINKLQDTIEYFSVHI